MTFTVLTDDFMSHLLSLTRDLSVYVTIVLIFYFI